MSKQVFGKIAIGAAIVGAAFLTGGASLVPSMTLAGTGATVGGFLATTALGSTMLAIGGAQILSGVASSFAKKPDLPSAQISRLNLSTNAAEPLKTAFGPTALATDVRYQEWNGPDQDITDIIVAHAAHRIGGVDEIYLDNELAWTSATAAGGKYAGYFFANTYVEGGPGVGPSLESGKWTSANSRLTGCGYSHLRFKLSGNSKKAESPFSSGVPTRITFRGRGSPVYDPRRDSTVPGGSGPMRADDQSTWAYEVDGDEIGANLALQILRYYLGWRINGKLAVGCGLPKKRLDMPSFLAAANLCSELVTVAAGGTEPRYHGGCVVSEADDPRTVVDMFCAGCNGRIREVGGKLGLIIAHNDLAEAAADDGLNDDDVMGAFSWNPDPSLEATPNIVRGRYTDPSPNSLFQMIPYADATLPNPDGIDRIFPLDLGAVQSPSHAQRVASQVLERKQYDRTFSAPFDIRAWHWPVGKLVPFTFAALGFDRKLFRVVDQELAEGGLCVMTLREEAAAIYAWDGGDGAPVTPAAPNIYDRRNNPIILGIDEAGLTATWNGVYGPGKPEDWATVGGTLGLDVKNPDGSLFVPEAFDPTYINNALATIETQVGDASTLIAGIQAKTRDGAPNLVPNADARNGLAGWNQIGTGWAAVAGFSNGPFFQNTGGAADSFLYRDVPVEAGVSYSLSAELQADIPGQVQAYVDWYDADGVYVAGPHLNIASSDWSRVASIAAVVPTGATTARILLHRTAAGGVIRATRVQFQRGAATGYNSAASDIETSTRVTTETIERTGETAALASRATILEATVYGSGPGTISATIGQVAQTAADETAAVGQLVTNITARIRRGSPNLLPEGDFPSGLGGWTTLGAGWSVATGYSVGPFAQNVGTAGAYLYRDVPAQALTSYSLSAEMDPDVLGAIEVYADWHNGAGVAIGSAGSIQGDGWARVSTSPAVAPAGTAFARIYVRSNTTGVFGRATRIQFQEGQPTDFDPSPSVAYSYALVAEERSARVTGEGVIAARADTLDAQMAGTADSVLKTTIQNNATAAADATAAVGQVTTALTARARQGAPNLLTRGDFRGGLDGWTTSGGWTVVTGFSVGPFLQKVGAVDGDYAFRDAGVTAGVSYSISAEMDPAPAGAAVVYIQWLGASGLISSTPSMTNSGWTRNSAGPFVAPTGATTARVVVQAVAAGTVRATRIQLQEGPATDWRDDADAIDLFASVTQQAGVLVDLQGRTQAYWSVSAAVPGERAQLTIFADNEGAGVDIIGDVRISGDLLVDGTVSYGAMNVNDFRSKVTDSDGGTYSNTTPGTDMAIAGINATLPNVKRDGELTFRVTGAVTLSSAGGGSNPAWDSILVIRAADAFGGALEYQVPLLQTTAPQFIIQRGDFDSLLTGPCTITAFIRHGSTNIVDGDPGIPDIKSVHITASNIAVDARWHW